MSNTQPQFKSNTVYYCHHVPSGEDWYVLGIRPNLSSICVAGYPPTMANFIDCTEWVEGEPLTQEELNYRAANFGTNWI